MRAWLPLLALALAQLADAAPKPPFGVGERLVYQGRWQRLDAGRARLEVAAGPRPGTFTLKADAETSRLLATVWSARYRAEVDCEAATLLPLAVRRESLEQGEQRVESAAIDRARRVVKVGGKQRPIAADAHDPLTAAYRLRTLRFGRLGSVQRIALSDLGKPLELAVHVVDRAEGVVQLRLVTRDPAEPGARSELEVALEEGGARRILEMKAALPFGEIRLDLVR